MTFHPAKFQKYLNSVNILANCFTSKGICNFLWDKHKSLVLELADFFYDWNNKKDRDRERDGKLSLDEILELLEVDPSIQDPSPEE